MTLEPPKYSFTALIPVRNEEKVIADTIRAVNNISYPQHLKEILIVMRNDDLKTQFVVEETLKELSNENIKIVILSNSEPINKPSQLNAGLDKANGDIVCVFDAEDEPHRGLYKIINTVYLRESVEVIQSGVQLMNYKDSWFSLLNVLEYFFWFKSGLQFFTKFGGVSPLGGNTVFFKRKWLEKIGGWDDKTLTEDADIGLRLSSMGAKTKIIYHPAISTREETPSSIESFIKQRTRWSQGFFQLLFKGDWLKLPTTKQKIMAFYILASPTLGLVSLIFIPFGIIVALTVKISIVLTLLSYIPFFVLILIISTMCVGYYEFSKAYFFNFDVKLIVKTLFYFVPYSLLIAYSTLRAIGRSVSGNRGWEKTAHFNAHRANYSPITQN
jgi:cellulose synthase/poly-beta-1,6-N-acetylglucosamine synthase-like glycosyltransferase